MRRSSCCAAAVALTLACSAALAQKPQAKGKFEGKRTTFEAQGAYAYPANVGFNDEPGYRLAVSNAIFVPEFMDHYWDREHFINTYFKDDETAVVEFQFGKDGAYKGLSYYLGSGDGCGSYFDGGVKSTVKVAAGRLVGRLSSPRKPGEVRFDLEFDVPIASSEYGQPLPASGGELGRVYAAFHAALATGDPAKVKPFMEEADLPEFAAQGREFVQALQEEHPTQSYKVTRGFVRGDRGLLLVEGETTVMRVTAEVHLIKERGTWRVEDEILKPRLGE